MAITKDNKILAEDITTSLEAVNTQITAVDSKLENYLPLSGGLMSGALNMGKHQISAVASIEITPPDATNNGGYIDFHFAGSSDDYTSRIIEESTGGLHMIAVTNGVKVNNKHIVRTVNGVAADAAGNVAVSSTYYAPNLASGVSISASTTYTTPSNGFVIAHVCSSNTATMTLKINGASLGLSQDDTGHDQICIPVKKGDTVYWSITSGSMNWAKTVTFYPAR